MSELKINPISDPKHTIIVDGNGKILYYNEAVQNRWKQPKSDNNSSKQLHTLTEHTKQIFHSKIKNILMDVFFGSNSIRYNIL